MGKLKTEDLVEAMLDKRVQDAMAANYTSGSLALMVEEPLTKKLESVLRKCSDLKKENPALKLALATAEKSIDLVTRSNAELFVRMKNQECYSRRENIVIRGMPEVSYAEAGSASVGCTAQDDIPSGTTLAVEQSVIALCRENLGIEILPGEISTAHRIKKGKKDLTLFVCTKTRNRVMPAKFFLKSDGSRIYILEHLTYTASKCFYEARKLVREKKIASAWTMNGQVYFKKTTDVIEKLSLMSPGLNI